MYQDWVILGLKDDTENPVNDTLCRADSGCFIRRNCNSVRRYIVVSRELNELRGPLLIDKRADTNEVR